MCQDCPTNKDRARAFGRELVADILTPFIVYGIVVGTLIITGVVKIF